ncbi:MAG: aminotransferase class V-fold PLP-dependent enzyme, partial [Proteobacteria bacterium]|nr:aminotransferase class V-fold PLP-dependent enzyme [Pseudomonadota bacterium]
DKPDLVSIQWVNSETGVINPVEEIGQLCRDAGVLFHTDAAQAVGKLEIDVHDLPIDFLTFTAHKFHGPTGIGILYAMNRNKVAPLIHGGDQEGGLRAGTENLAGIVGTGVAAEIRRKRLTEIQSSLREIRELFENSLIDAFPWIEINGGGQKRVCNTSNMHFCGIDGQALVAQLDVIGIQCSQSSACTNLRPEPSYVLRAMGLTEEEAYASVRFSFGEQNTADEIQAAVVDMTPVIQRLRTILA